MSGSRLGASVRRVSWLLVLAVLFVGLPAVPGGADPAVEIDVRLEDFVILGMDSVEFGRDVRVVAGDVGAVAHGGVIELDRDVVFEDVASRLMGDRIDLGAGVSVFDVYANALSGAGEPAGSVISPIRLPLGVDIPDPPNLTPGSDDLTVAQGGNLVLESGQYGSLAISRDSTVTLTGGIYEFSGWSVDRGVQILATGPVDIRLAGSASIDRDVVLRPDPAAGLSAFDVRITLTGDDSVMSVGRGSSVGAIVTAVAGSVELDRGVTATGSFVARVVSVGRDSVLEAAALSTDGDPDGDGLPNQLESYLGTSPVMVDTDSDGLDDGVEFLNLYPWADPTVADTDGNGVADDADDIDGDGLSAVAELALGTDPLSPDSDGDGLDDSGDTAPIDADGDGDGLNDAVEERLGTDPANPDSDGDGILDALDSHSTSVAVGGSVVSVSGIGDLPGELHIVDLGTQDSRPTGLIGSTYRVSLPFETETVLESAEVTLSYDPLLVSGEEMDLLVFHWSDDVGMWLPAAAAENQTVDTVANTVTSPTQHFSLFAVGDLGELREYWSQNSEAIAACEVGGSESLYLNRRDTLMAWDGTAWDTAATLPRVNGQFVRFAGVMSDGADVYTWSNYREYDIDALVGYVQQFDPVDGLTQIGSFDRAFVRDLVVSGDLLYALVEPGPSVPDSDGAGSELWVYHDGASWTRVAAHSSGYLAGRAVATDIGGSASVVWSHEPSYNPVLAPYSLVYSEGQELVTGAVEAIPGRYSYAWGASFGLPIPIPGTEASAAFVANSAFEAERGEGGVFRSTNGVDWQERPAPGPITTAVMHDGVPILGSFVVDYSYDTGESQDEAVYSFDGDTFTTLNDTLNVRWSSSASGGGFLYMSGETYTVSPDGESPPSGVFRSLDGSSFEQILVAPIDEGLSRLAYVAASEVPDTDGDGLSDCLETVGLPTFFGIITTDPLNPDTDGDELLDGNEIAKIDLTTIVNDGEVASEIAGVDLWFYGWSNPLLADTDSDGLDDFIEFEIGSRARRGDTDSDGLSDLDEANLGTDLWSVDTDGDSFTDFAEVSAAEEGFDPTYFDERVSKWRYVHELTLGAICGDALGICERDSVAWLAGNLGTGFFAVADLRDFFSSVFRGAWVGAGLSLLGIIPLIGDYVKASDTISDFMRRIPAAKIADSARWVLRQDWIPTLARRSVLGLVDGANDLRARGVSDDVLLRLVRGNTPDLRRLDDVLDGATDLRAAPRFFGDLADEAGAAARGNAGEVFLRQDLGIAEDTFKRTGIKSGYRWAPGRETRFPDAIVSDGLTSVIHESKVGYVRWSTKIETQILKDASIVRNRVEEVTGAVWHFFPSGVGDTIGADPRVLNLLEEHGIEYVVWMP